jgi:four helix bundle protein
MQNHHNLLVWQKARALAVRVYRLTRRLAQIDRTGLASQLRRASQSVRANIAEGCSRPSNRDFAKFLRIAIASATEVEDHLQFTLDVELLTSDDVRPLLDQVIEVRRMLYGLIKKVDEDGSDGS